MPFKSYRQFKKFVVLKKEGKVSQDTFDEFVKNTDFPRLPLKAKKK